MTNQTKIALGILGAVAVGAIAGILMAPEKGSETRKSIADSACDWADKFGSLMDSGKEKVSKLKREYKQKADAVEADLS